MIHLLTPIPINWPNLNKLIYSQNNPMRMAIITILPVRKLIFRKGNRLFEVHIDDKWWNQLSTFNSGKQNTVSEVAFSKRFLW